MFLHKIALTLCFMLIVCGEVFAAPAESKLKTTTFGNNFSSQRFIAEGKVVGLRKLGTKGGKQVWIVVYDPATQKFSSIARTPLKSIPSAQTAGDPDFKYNEHGEALFIVNQYNSASYSGSLAQGAYYQSADGTLSKLELNFSESDPSYYRIIGFNANGVGVIHLFHSDFSDYETPTYAFIDRGVVRASWKNDLGNYATEFFLSDGRLLAVSSDPESPLGEMKIVSPDGVAHSIPAVALPEAITSLQVPTDDGRMIVGDWNNPEKLFVTDFTNPIEEFGIVKSRATVQGSSALVLTSEGDFVASYTADTESDQRYISFAQSKASLEGLDCMLKNSTRKRIIEVKGIAHTGKLLVRLANIGGYSPVDALIEITDLNEALPDYCATLTRPTFGAACGGKTISHPDSVTVPSQVFVSAQAIPGLCTVSFKVRDRNGKPIHGAVARLIDKGEWRPDADGGGYFDTPRLIDELRTDKSGHVVLSGRFFASNHDFEVITPFFNQKYRSSSLYLVGPKK